MTLDEYINLRERVEDRMEIVNITATGDDNLLSNKPTDLEYRKEQLSRLQNKYRLRRYKYRGIHYRFRSQ